MSTPSAVQNSCVGGSSAIIVPGESVSAHAACCAPWAKSSAPHPSDSAQNTRRADVRDAAELHLAARLLSDQPVVGAVRHGPVGCVQLDEEDALVEDFRPEKLIELCLP